ncbi:MAG: hypothetical protein HKN68_13530 [Saprospiraceae bacterium]|nr:hypothetical protein [Saprospiraceae bacterium]
MHHRKTTVIIISWLSMIATDFLIHGGILASLYMKESPFLLSAELAFIRIPLGYLSFLLLAWLLYYFFKKEWPINKRDGFTQGLTIGAIVWGSMLMGLYSISTIDPLLALGWMAGQSVEMGIGGYFMVFAHHSEKVSKPLKVLGLFFLLMIVITIILQVAGIAPAVKIN